MGYANHMFSDALHLSHVSGRVACKYPGLGLFLGCWAPLRRHCFVVPLVTALLSMLSETEKILLGLLLKKSGHTLVTGLPIALTFAASQYSC